MKERQVGQKILPFGNNGRCHWCRLFQRLQALETILLRKKKIQKVVSQ
jgi:hypothetical protein